MKKRIVSSSFRYEEDCRSSSADENWNNRLYISKCKGLTCNKLLKINRSQAEIVTTVLLILIVIASIAVIWVVVGTNVKNSTNKSNSEILNIRLEISKVKYWQNGSVEVDVSRGADNGDMTQLEFIFYNKNGDNKIITKNVNLSSKSSRQFFFAPSEIGFGSNEIDKVSVSPVFGDDVGIEVFQTSNKPNANGMVNLYDDLLIPNGSLISWWKFDDNDGRDYIDGNTGTLVCYSTGCVNPTISLGRLDFTTAVKGYLRMGAVGSPPANLALGDKITISFWTIFTSSNDLMGILKRGHYNSANYANQEYSIATKSGGYIRFILGNGTYDVLGFGHDTLESTKTINDGKWHYVACVLRQDNTTEIYLDGNLDNSSKKSLIFNASDDLRANKVQEFGFLKVSTGSLYFNGKLDDVMFFNASLTATQIKTLYLDQNKTNRP